MYLEECNPKPRPQCLSSGVVAAECAPLHHARLVTVPSSPVLSENPANKDRISPFPSSQHKLGTQSMLRQMAGASVSRYESFPLGRRQKPFVQRLGGSRTVVEGMQNGQEGETRGPCMLFPKAQEPAPTNRHLVKIISLQVWGGLKIRGSRV